MYEQEVTGPFLKVPAFTEGAGAAEANSESEDG